MFFEFITNFSILFCFSILIFWPFIQYSNNPFIMNYKSLIAGLTFGFAALILSVLTAPFANGVLINSRTIFLLFGGLLGGPTTILIAGFLIVIGRKVLFFTSTLSIIMMYNMLFITCGTAYAAYKRPITYQNLPIYFYALTFEHIFVLLVYYRFSIEGVEYLTIYLLFSMFTFFAIRKILSQLEHKNKQIKQIYSLRKMDFLTQLPNNIAIEKRLTSYMNAKVPFELLHIDIRHFQDINFTYHYKTGDEILIEVAQIIQQQLPSNAYFGRIGSDEFYVVLPSLAPAQSITIASEIDQSIRQFPFETFEKSCEVQVSLAIGISSYPSNAIKLNQLYQNCSHALTQAKLQKTVHIFHYNQLQ